MTWLLAGEAKKRYTCQRMIKHKSHTTKGTNTQASSTVLSKTRPAAIKLGLDVHADSIVVVRIVDNSGPQPPQKFTRTQFLTWVEGQLGQAREVYSCYETGSFGFGLHRELEALGVRNVVVQGANLDERHTRVNHDASDARELALRLDRYVAGNRHALAIVRVPTPEQEQRRAESRQREQVRRSRQRAATQGRTLLLNQGYRESNNWWQPRRWERLLPQLPPWLAELLQNWMEQIEVQNRILQKLTTRLEKAAETVRPKGLGGLTSEVINREVVDWSRFHNRRQVASYTGLCGGVSASGPSRRDLSITKHGNTRLRAALIELAWRMVLWQSQSRLVQRWKGVLFNPRATGAARKKAIVALARQLAVDLWRWHTGRVKPEDLGWIMAEA